MDTLPIPVNGNGSNWVSYFHRRTYAPLCSHLLGSFSEHGIQRIPRAWLRYFFSIHVFLHVLFLKHPTNQFTSLFSWVFLLGAGIAGIVDIVVRWS